jgi:HlyD family secretion protein
MWLLVLLAAGVALAYLGRSFILGPVVSTSIVQRQDIVLTVVASGLVGTPYRIDFGSKIIGVVTDVPVEEGQTVAAGDLLIRLDDTQARKAVETANASVAQARAKLDQLQHVAAPVAEEMRRQAEANLVDAQAAYRRAFDLARRGFETGAALDAASRALNIALSQSRAAEI